MAEVYVYNREAIRVKVKKCEPNIPPEWRKFSVDPQITSLEVLYSILAKAFDIKSDFSICYKTLDTNGHETYVSVLSDWDLDAAFLKAHNISIQTGNEPCLNLRVDIKAFSEATDWETSSQITKEIISLHQSVTGAGQKYVQNMQNKLPGLIMNQMEKTFSMVQRALNLTDIQVLAQPPRPPLSDSEFRRFLDSVGQILQPNELRKVIFAGGIDPSLRKVVWKHILNVYPTGMTGRERMDYMKKKATEYYKLRDVWKSAVQKGPVVGELAFVTSMVRKDVLRTDRLHPFYAGSDDNQNIASLFNILTTYALNHPSVSYCQGMSDIASPLLVTMGDEAHAYICFCAVMGRLKANFMLDGIAMTLKFTHLAEALHFYDSEFYDYLKQQQADDLLFCYRWLLLEMKREFAFDDSLRMLEVLWSSLRYEPPTKELDLFEKEFEPSSPDIPPPKSPSVVLRTPRENHYTKVCALRRQSSSASLLSNSPSSINSINSLTNSTGFLNSGGIGSSCNIGSDGKLTAIKKFNQSLDENMSRSPRTKSAVKAHQSLDETKMIMLMEKMSTFKDNVHTTATTSIANATNAEQRNVVPANSDEEQPIKNTFHPTNPFIDDVDLDELNTAVCGKDKSKIEQAISLSIDKIDNSDRELSNIIDVDEGKNLSPKRNSKLNHTKIQKANNVKLQNKNAFSCNTSNNIISKQIMNKKGGHFKELKEKIAASKKGILASLDKIENQFEITAKQEQNQSSIIIQNSDESIKSSSNTVKNKNQKIVKNFNEFLNFTSINKNRISDKMITSNNNSNKIMNKTLSFNDDKNCIDRNENRSVIKLKKNSVDGSDSILITNETQLQIEQQDNKIGECVEQSSSSSSTTTAATLINNSKQPLQLHLTNIVAQTQQSLDGSSPDDSQDYYPMTTSMTRELRLELENLDRQVFGDIGMLQKNNFKYDTNIEYEKLGRDSLDMLEVHDEEIIVCPEPSEIIIMRNQDKGKNIDMDPLKRISSCSAGTDIFIWENPLHQISGASSCNFNEIAGTDIISDEEKGNNYIKELGYIVDGNKNNGHPKSSTITPDEQQELEYDGDIIIECLIQDDNTTKTNKSVALVQTNTSVNNTKMHDCDNSDSDNTDNSNNLNPFSSHYKFSTVTPASSTIIMTATTPITTEKQLLQQQQQLRQQTKQISNIFDKDSNKQEENIKYKESIMVTMTETSTAAKTSTNSQITIDDESDDTNVIGFTKINDVLPPPDEFGGGNPFLMFLCLTLLLQHRNYVMKNGLDYNEMAMHFDKMVRKHDVNRVLNQARRMYFEYLKIQSTKQQQQQQQFVVNSSFTTSENYNYNNNNKNKNNSNSN